MDRVRFRYGTPVTTVAPLYPELSPGAFTFDSSTFALYLDTDSTRVQVQDPLKLSIDGGGTISGDVNVVDQLGTTMCSLSSSTGAVTGTYLESTGNIALSTAPNLYAVIDSNGRIRTRTAEEMVRDLHIADPGSLGDLAYCDSVSGTYTPVGTVSAPTVTVNYDTESVVKSISAGTLPSLDVEGEVLSFDAGTPTTSSNTNVMKSVTSVDVSTPVFTGTTATITSGPAS